MKPHPKHRVFILVITALLLSLASCEELFFEPVPDATPLAVFDQVWDFVDEEYSFFEYKGIDWDAVRQTYEPLVTNGMSDTELFNVLADMLFELQDGHVNLVSPFDVSRNWQWFLSGEPNYDYSVLERDYFTDGAGRSIHQYVGDAFILMDFRDPAGDVGYIHYRSFTSPVRESDMDYVIERFRNHDGLIIDVRNNGGGSLSNVFAIGNRLTDTSVRFADEYVKNGPDRDDFAPPRGRYLAPVSGKESYTKPIVVLTNRACYSATNYFVTAVRELPHVATMGDWTGGGGGVPAYTQLTNGWGLRVSSTRLYSVDETGTLPADPGNVEGGIEPDMSRTSTEADLANGVDAILDEALAYIRGL